MLEMRSVAEVRAAEEPLLSAGVPLMERAATALAEQVHHSLTEAGAGPGASIALLVGAGNNGGDALYAGAQLARRGYAVTAYLTGSQAHSAGLAALRAAGGRAVKLQGALSHQVTSVGGIGEASVRIAAEAILRSAAIVDGLLGIGATGAMAGVPGELVAALNHALPNADPRPIVVAVDTPSGIGVDDGTLPGPVLPADNTVTFGAVKPGLALPPANRTAGRTHLVDIGLDFAANRPAPSDGPPAPRIRRLEAADVAASWPIPGPSDHKYTRGVVGVIAGTNLFPGAAILTCSAAVLAGAGMVRYQGPTDVARMVIAARPEVVPADGQVQAWVLGPGLPTAASGGGDDDGQMERARAALMAAAGLLPGAGTPVPAVLDAGGLGLIERPLPAWVVLTPHAGELAALLRSRGQDVDRAAVEAEPLKWATKAHELTGATVLLKGGTTIVVGPGEHGGVQVFSQADAPAWLATAGAGDVLAGLLGTMLAARSKDVVAHPWLAGQIAAEAALVHGYAAERANPGGPVAALEVAQAIPKTVAEILASN